MVLRAARCLSLWLGSPHGVGRFICVDPASSPGTLSEPGDFMWRRAVIYSFVRLRAVPRRSSTCSDTLDHSSNYALFHRQYVYFRLDRAQFLLLVRRCLCDHRGSTVGAVIASCHGRSSDNCSEHHQYFIYFSSYNPNCSLCAAPVIFCHVLPSALKSGLLRGSALCLVHPEEDAFAALSGDYKRYRRLP